MSKLYHHSARINGHIFVATLLVSGATCYENVTVDNAMGNRTIHESEFPTSNLGGASRDNYLRAMTASIARDYFKTV